MLESFRFPFGFLVHPFRSYRFPSVDKFLFMFVSNGDCWNVEVFLFPIESVLCCPGSTGVSSMYIDLPSRNLIGSVVKIERFSTTLFLIFTQSFSSGHFVTTRLQATVNILQPISPGLLTHGVQTSPKISVILKVK